MDHSTSPQHNSKHDDTKHATSPHHLSTIQNMTIPSTSPHHLTPPTFIIWVSPTDLVTTSPQPNSKYDHPQHTTSPLHLNNIQNKISPRPRRLSSTPQTLNIQTLKHRKAKFLNPQHLNPNQLNPKHLNTLVSLLV